MRLLFLLSFGLVFSLSNGQKINYDTIRYAKDHYNKRVAQFKSEPIKKNRIMFLGNSITEFGDWKQLLQDSTIINRGIAGDNTFGVLDRLEDVIVRQPRKLFIKVGINDVSQNIPEDIIVKNILTIIEHVKSKSPATAVYVHSILPTNDNVKNEYPDAFHKNDRVTKINILLKKNAAKHNFTYINLIELLSDKTGKLEVKYAQPDGLHLNEMGYKIWVNFLKNKKYL
jgi:lysophospholipase L1-like esterase